MLYRSFNLIAAILLCLTWFYLPAQTVVKNRNPISGNEAEHEALHQITKNDEVHIKSLAVRVVNRYMDLLNFISTGSDLDVSEIEKVIRESYSLSQNKIFYDSTSVIEDDLRSLDSQRTSKEKSVHAYLNDFDLLYKKSKDLNVAFSNLKVSNVKSGSYLYIKVFYDCLFENRSLISDLPYTIKKRVSELKVEKVNNRWNAWIINIHNQNFQDTAEADKNDVPVSGPDVAESGELSAGQRYAHHIKEALYAESQRNYEAAIQNYISAQKYKSGEDAKLTLKIQQLP